MKGSYPHINIPESKKRTGRICHISSELTGTNADLDEDIHWGFTVGRGKTMYWLMLWHGSGNVTVYSRDGMVPRWLSGDAEITIHFK